jgi:hypothetical protein
MTSQLDVMIYERDALVSNKIPKKYPDNSVITSSEDENFNLADDIFSSGKKLDMILMVMISTTELRKHSGNINMLFYFIFTKRSLKEIVY